ncbi:MAG: hypothetical protein PHN45_12605 [Methylococcales bacterium]|nr:hypothetical protein [Methylococcales bacterium]
MIEDSSLKTEDAKPASATEDDYVCLAMSHQDTLNSMFDAIKDFVQEVNIRFTKDDMEIIKADNTGVVMVSMKLSKKDIETAGGLYVYKTGVSCVEVCLNVKLLSNVFKSAVSQGDIVEIRVVASESNFVHIIERNVNTLKSIKSSVRVIKSDTVEDNDYVHKLVYSGCITMESVEFYDNIKKLCITESNTVRLFCDGDTLSMSAAGQFTNIMLDVHLHSASEALKMMADEVNTKRRMRKDRARQTSQIQSSSNDVPCDVNMDVMTVDPMLSSSLEKRFACIRRGSALFCKTNADAVVNVDEDYPLSFLMRIAKSKSVSKTISMLINDEYPVITLSFDTEIGCLRFILGSKEKNIEMRQNVPLPKCVIDSLSKQVDEACKDKCNSIKRKRTRRVWSRKDTSAPLSKEQACSDDRQSSAKTTPRERRKYVRKNKHTNVTVKDEDVTAIAFKPACERSVSSDEKMKHTKHSKQRTLIIQDGMPLVHPSNVVDDVKEQQSNELTSQQQNLRRLRMILMHSCAVNASDAEFAKVP